MGLATIPKVLNAIVVILVVFHGLQNGQLLPGGPALGGPTLLGVQNGPLLPLRLFLDGETHGTKQSLFGTFQQTLAKEKLRNDALLVDGPVSVSPDFDNTGLRQLFQIQLGLTPIEVMPTETIHSRAPTEFVHDHLTDRSWADPDTIIAVKRFQDTLPVDWSEGIDNDLGRCQVLTNDVLLPANQL